MVFPARPICAGVNEDVTETDGDQPGEAFAFKRGTRDDVEQLFCCLLDESISNSS